MYWLETEYIVNTTAGEVRVVLTAKAFFAMGDGGDVNNDL
jgi:hypothetical protein